MKLVIGGVIFLILCTSLALATETTIFNDWTGYNSQIEDGNRTFDIKGADVNDPDEDKGKILLKVGTDRFIIDFGECVEAPTYKYCFENRSYDEEGVDIDDKGQLQPALLVLLQEFELEVDLDTSKGLAKTSFRVDETADVTMVLENTGDFDITNVKLVEIVPDNFEIIRSDHPFVGQRLERNLNLFAGNSWETSYTIKALEARTVNYSTSLSYTAQGEDFEITFGEKTLSFDESHTFKEPTLSSEFSRNDKVNFGFSVLNKEAIDITVQSVEFEVSPQVVSTERKNIDKQSPTRFTNSQETVSPGQTEEFEIAMEFPTIGVYEVKYVADVVVRNEVFTYNDTFEFEVLLDELKCTIDIPDVVNASSIVRTNIIVENGEGEPFYEIEGSYQMSNEAGEYQLSNINREQSVIVDRVDLIIPFDLEEKNYTLTHEATYRTIDQQYFSCSFEKNITANAAIQLIDMQVQFEDEIVQRNETTNIIIELENLLQEPITDEIDVFISSVHGTARPKLLNGLTTTQTIEIPFTLYEFLRSENATITANLKIPALNNYADSAIALVPVSNPYTGNLTIWELEEQARDELQEELEQREIQRQSRSFFDKIIDYLQDFFK